MGRDRFEMTTVRLLSESINKRASNISETLLLRVNIVVREWRGEKLEYKIIALE